jgi:hypothetical protein
MEIHPPSTTAQISAYFTGFTNDEKVQQFLDLQPGTIPFKPENSLDRVSAISSSGEFTDFKTEDFVYAWQMYTGQLMYPFDSIAQVTHHQFDPSYFDGSEERQADFNLQENLIGMPLDSPQLVDPRVSYIDSLMKMREHHAGNLPLDESYLNTLFMSTTEKGANYYLNQLNDLQEAMGNHARTGFALKNSVNIPEDFYRQQIGKGVPSHDRPRIESRYMENHSQTTSVQSNFRRDRMKNSTPEALQMAINKDIQRPPQQIPSTKQPSTPSQSSVPSQSSTQPNIPYSSNAVEETRNNEPTTSQIVTYDPNFDVITPEERDYWDEHRKRDYETKYEKRKQLAKDVIHYGMPIVQEGIKTIVEEATGVSKKAQSVAYTVGHLLFEGFNYLGEGYKEIADVMASNPNPHPSFSKSKQHQLLLPPPEGVTEEPVKKSKKKKSSQSHSTTFDKIEDAWHLLKTPVNKKTQKFLKQYEETPRGGLRKRKR